MSAYLPTTCNRIAFVGAERVVVMTVPQAQDLMLDFERMHDNALRADPADRWGIAKVHHQAAQAVGEALLTLQNIAARAA